MKVQSRRCLTKWPKYIYSRTGLAKMFLLKKKKIMKDYLLPLHFDLKFGNFTLSFDRLRQRNALKFVRTCSTIIVSHSINHHVVVCFVVCVAFCRRRFLNSSRKTRNGNTFFYSADKVNMHISHLILFFSTTHFPRLFLRLGMQLQRASEILFNTEHLERL